jgi:hypothetical protein
MVIIFIRETEAKKEKIKEKIVRSRENKGMVFKKNEASKLLKRRMMMEKVGKRKREAVEANWFSPQGRE